MTELEQLQFRYKAEVDALDLLIEEMRDTLLKSHGDALVKLSKLRDEVFSNIQGKYGLKGDL